MCYNDCNLNKTNDNRLDIGSKMKVYKTSATCLIPEIVGRLTVGNPLEKRIVFCEDKFTLALELAIAKASL